MKIVLKVFLGFVFMIFRVSGVKSQDACLAYFILDVDFDAKIFASFLLDTLSDADILHLFY